MPSQTDCVQMEDIQDQCYLPEKWSTDNNFAFYKSPRTTVSAKNLFFFRFYCLYLGLLKKEEESRCVFRLGNAPSCWNGSAEAQGVKRIPDSRTDSEGMTS